MRTVEVGQIVASKAGRDEGRLFLVLNVIDDQYVELVDGTLRKLAKPKKKKNRHIEPQNGYCESIKAKLEQGKQVFDAEIRASLEQFKSTGDQ